MKANRIRILGSSLLALGALTLVTPDAFAGLTGNCGMVVAVPHTYVFGSVTGTVNSTGNMNGYAQLVPPGSTKGVNLLAVINFTSSTISYEVTQVTVGNASTGTSNSYSTQNGSASFTTAAGPLPGSYTITFTPTGSPQISLNLLPVNSGNTILVQGTTGTASALTGVCQAL